MRYLRKFETNVYKEPIDVDLDIDEFWFIFGDKIRSEDNNTEMIFKKEPFIRKVLDELSQNFGDTMTDDYRYYDICQVDEYGRRNYLLMTVTAVSQYHARVKGAIKTKNIEIFTTGYYYPFEVKK